jgi:hypothetical protein
VCSRCFAHYCVPAIVKYPAGADSPLPEKTLSHSSSILAMALLVLSYRMGAQNCH